MKKRLIGFTDFVRRPDHTYVAFVWHGSSEHGNGEDAEFLLTHEIRRRLAYLCPSYAWAYNPTDLNYLGGPLEVPEVVQSYQNYLRFKASL